MIDAAPEAFITPSHSAFLNRIAAEFAPSHQAQAVLIVHCLDNAMPFLQALSKIYKISRIIPVPYSAKPEVMSALALHHDLTAMSLQEMQAGVILKEIVAECILSSDLPLILFDIGGYFTHAIPDILSRHPGRLIGVVEETEAGHRRYLEADQIACPVVSVARSSLKSAENRLVGAAIAFSAERILRDCGRIPVGLRAGVIGYGNIGQPLCRALLTRGMRVCVDDISKVRRCWSLCDGFDAPGKEAMLASVDLVLGVTGARSVDGRALSGLRSGVFLMSGSSKRVEFDVDWIARNTTDIVRVTPEVSIHGVASGKKIALACEGEPINFSDRAELAQVIALVHAEVVAAAQHLTRLHADDRRGGPSRLLEVPPETREKTADLWLSAFAGQNTVVCS